MHVYPIIIYVCLKGDFVAIKRKENYVLLSERTISVIANMKYELNLDTDDINEIIYRYYKEMRTLKDKYYQLGLKAGLVRCK